MDLTKHPLPSASATSPSPKYYAMIGGEQRGPFTLDELVGAGVRPQTYVWCRGMNDWERAEDVADICRYFRVRLHDLMHPGNPTVNESRSESQAPDSYESSGMTLRGLSDSALPSVEEISEPANPDKRPASMLGLAIAATIIFPFLGWIALRSALACRKAWRQDMKKEAHDLSTAAKMWSGISLFMGLILWTTLLRNI